MAKMTLIIRPQPDADRDVALLGRYGVPALASPSMTSVPQLNKLPDAEKFSGIILTSRNAVDAITKSGKTNIFTDTDTNAHSNIWAKLPAFVVGRATAAAARDAGFLNIIPGGGSGAGLLAPIECYFSGKMGSQDGRNHPNLPLCWTSAADISFDMVAALTGHDIEVQRLPVYKMIANDTLDAALANKIEQGAIAAVVAMSPRSVQIFRKNLDAIGKASSLARMTLIAGSAAISVAAGKGWQAVYVAREPRRVRVLAIAVLRHRFDH